MFSMLAPRSALLSLCLATAALSPAAVADDATGTTEIDVIFPRNDTFAPMQLMPVVFAVRNPKVAKVLNPTIGYTIYSLDKPGTNITYKPMTSDSLDLPSDDDSTYLWYQGETNRFLDEGRWVFQWGYGFDNCSTTDDPAFQDRPYTPVPVEKVYEGFHLGSSTFVQNFVFTIGKDGASPDLAKLTGSDSCKKAQGLAYKVDSQLDIPEELQQADITKCAKFPATTPTPSPCEVTVDAAAASSISAALTSTHCGGPSPSISCPPEEDAAGGRPTASYSMISAVFSGWLLYTLLLA